MSVNFRIVTALTSALSLASTGLSPAQSGPPEIVFVNGTVLSMDGNSFVETEAAAVRDGLILAIGPRAEIEPLAALDHTAVIDLNGRFLGPAFVDAHSHLFNGAANQGLEFEDTQSIALANGITTVGNLFSDEQFLGAMRDFEQRGLLQLRTSLYLTRVTNCGEDTGDWYTAHPPTRGWGETLRIGGVKVFTDGGSCGLPATSFEYLGGHGDLFFSQDDMNRIVAEVDAAGYQIAIHAQGDVAIEQALDALEALGTAPANASRHRIEHNAFVRPDMLSRYSDVGAVAIFFGEFPTCAEIDEQTHVNLFGFENVLYLEDWRAVLDANPGMNAAWHSDWPFFTMDPLKQMHSYVTRADIREDGTVCEPPEWLAEHRITSEEAYRLMTMGGAYALDRDTEVGSIEPGKLADLVILAENPLAANPAELAGIEVLATYVGGNAAYCRDAASGLCPTGPVSTEVEIPQAAVFQLEPAYPNPFSGSTTVPLVLTENADVRIGIYDLSGRRVRILTRERYAPGRHAIEVDLTDLPAGAYLIHAVNQNRTRSRMVVSRPRR